MASINRYLGEPGTTAVPADAAELVGDGLTVTESRPMGTVHLLDGDNTRRASAVGLRRCAGYTSCDPG